MLDTMAATLSIMGLNYLSTGKTPQQLGNAHPNIVPYQAFATSDGNIVLAAANDEQFQRFCAFANIEELAIDKRFSSNELRVYNRKELTEKLQSVIAKKTSQHWLEGLEKIKVTCGPINTIEQVFDDPQIKSRGMKIEMPHLSSGNEKLKLIASPIRFSRTNVEYRYAPPVLGEHTEEILKELLGMDRETITDLRQKEVI